MLQDIIIATEIRAKMEGVAVIMKQKAFVIAETVSSENTANVSKILACIHVLSKMVFTLTVRKKHSVNIV